MTPGSSERTVSTFDWTLRALITQDTDTHIIHQTLLPYRNAPHHFVLKIELQDPARDRCRGFTCIAYHRSWCELLECVGVNFCKDPVLVST
jgi:hypothetical protein